MIEREGTREGETALVAIGRTNDRLEEGAMHWLKEAARVAGFVLICEAAAQLCTYQVQKHGAMNVDMMGFGGLDKVRFRGIVRPGDRLLLICKRVALRPRAMIRCAFQAFVGSTLVGEGELVGVAIPVEMVQNREAGQG